MAINLKKKKLNDEKENKNKCFSDFTDDVSDLNIYWLNSTKLRLFLTMKGLTK